MKEVKVGDVIKINYFEGMPDYAGRLGTITRIDDYGKLYGTWGKLEIDPEIDSFQIVKKGDNNED